jgi:hypothetical protein
MKNGIEVFEKGGILNSYINADNHRKSFIGKEKDYESFLGDFGVRKPRRVGMQAYDDLVGRFFQVDLQPYAKEV